MKNTVKIGYIRKIDRAGNTVCMYAYSDLYTDYALRIRIRNELISGKCRLFCACCQENDSPVTIGDADSGYNLIFSEKHDEKCAKQFDLIKQVASSTVLGMFMSKGGCLPVSFRFAKRTRSIASMIELLNLTDLSLETFVYLTNIISYGRYGLRGLPLPSFEKGVSSWKALLGMYATRYNTSIRKALQFIPNGLSDGKDDITFRYTNDMMFKEWEKDTVKFYIGRIDHTLDQKLDKELEEGKEVKYGAYMYLICKSDESRKTKMIGVKRDAIYPFNLDLESGDIGIAGFVESKEKKYDPSLLQGKRTSISVKVSVAQSSHHEEIKHVAHFRSFVVFYMSKSGMICSSPKELQVCNDMTDNKVPIYKSCISPVGSTTVSAPIMRFNPNGADNPLNTPNNP